MNADTTEETRSNDVSTTGKYRHSRVTWLMVTALLVPVGMAMVFSTSTTALPPLTVTKPRPSLLFGTYLYHHGEAPVELDTTLESEFRFRNDGMAPVVIDRIERSCGCMTPRVASKHIAPGETGSVFVPIQTINQSPGPHEYTLTVHYTDPEPQQATLSIKAVFPEQMVVVQPRALYLSQRSSKPVPFRVTISDFREQTLKVTNVESTMPFVSTEIDAFPSAKAESQIVQTSYESDASESPQSASRRLNISGEVAGSIPPGRHHAIVAATTDDPEFGIVTVPMVVNGPAYPDGETPVVSPSQIQLWASEHPQAQRKIRVKVVIPSTWKLSHATAWPEELSVTYGKPQTFSETEVMIPVEVELTNIPNVRMNDGVVQLFANEGQNLVTIRATLIWP